MPAKPPEKKTGADGLGLGDRMRSARKARAVSIERIAEELNLDESIILALEEERFDELGAPVFVRGHLKAYARLVGLSPDVVMDAYQEAKPPEPAVSAVERPVRRSVAVNPVILGFSALVMLVGVLLTIYVMQDDETSVSTTGQESQPETTSVDPATATVSAPPIESVTGNPEATMLDESGIEAGTGESLVVGTATVVAQPEAESELVENMESSSETETVAESAVMLRPDVVRLSLHFKEESWVEISDANKRLLFGLQRQGRRRELAGEPPFKLLIGNANAVELTVNDEPFAVPSSGVNGKIARFEIDAGSLE